VFHIFLRLYRLFFSHTSHIEALVKADICLKMLVWWSVVIFYFFSLTSHFNCVDYESEMAYLFLIGDKITELDPIIGAHWWCLWIDQSQIWREAIVGGTVMWAACTICKTWDADISHLVNNSTANGGSCCCGTGGCQSQSCYLASMDSKHGQVLQGQNCLICWRDKLGAESKHSKIQEREKQKEKKTSLMISDDCRLKTWCFAWYWIHLV
jgi:hypothetical protein